jgi:hypothetical protein
MAFASVYANCETAIAALDKGSGLAQSNDGVDPHSAARGDIAGRKRHNDEDNGGADKGERYRFWIHLLVGFLVGSAS